MTYSIESPLTGHRALLQPWYDVLKAHGAYGGADAILSAYSAWGQKYNIDEYLALAQACHESTYFTSTRWREEWNPAGLGITADNTPPNPFASMDEGIRAHIEHLCCHAYTTATCPADHAHLADRRHFFHRGEPALQDIQKAPYRWAAGLPGSDPLDYVRSIVAIANAVGGTPTVADPYDRIHTSADVGPSRTLDSIRWLIVHDTEGHFAGDESVLTSGAPPVESANFLVGRIPGQCVYIVPITATAWAAGNDQVGEQAVQVELSRGTDETGYTDYQYNKLAEIYRWCVQEGMTGVPPVYLGLHPADTDSGPEPDDPGIIGHAGVPNPNGLGASPAWGGFAGHTDPGPDFDWPRFIGLLGSAPPDNKVNGHVLSGGFRALWDATPDRLRIMGLPVSEEYDGTLTTADGVLPVTIQDFERVKMVYDLSTPDPFRVRVPLRSEIVKRLAKAAKK